MTHFKCLHLEIYTKRLHIRTLRNSDDFTYYLQWMRDSSNSFIRSINSSYSQEDLRTYVKDKNESEFALLLGLFDISTNQHIGNIKFEPIVCEDNYAVLGIFIGDNNYRGIGLAKEVIVHTFKKVLINYGIERLILGVAKKNKVAMSAYSKCGFILSDNPVLNMDKESVEMVLHLNNIYM